MAVPAPASAAEAMDMVLTGLRNLAATDPTALAAEAQAACLRTLEHVGAISTAVRARFLAAFTAGHGYCEDADYGPTAWLIHRTRITKGAARGHLGWARRDVTHPQVVATLAEGTVLSESMASIICCWTDKLPEECRQAADAILIAAARAGARKEDLAGLAAEIYARSHLDDDPERSFEDRKVTVETTFAGAGVMAGDLTPECAAVVTAVLESLSAPMGAADTRTKQQRYHDGLQEAMRRLIAAGLLPERAGQPVKIWAHVTLAELLAMDDGSVLAGQWIAEMAARWAAHRAAESGGAGGDGGAWLNGRAARAMACDAIITPIVTGDVDPGVLDDLVRLCVELDRIEHGTASPADPPVDARPDPSPSREALRRAIIGQAVDLLSGPGGLAGFLRTRQLGARLAGPSLPWTSGSARRSRRASATRSSCGTGGAAGRAAAASPRWPAKCTTSST